MILISVVPHMMRHLAWLTDIHLNFLAGEAVYRFFDTLAASAAEAFLLGGDIAEAEHLCLYLSELAEAVQRPVHLVLGNHDFYGSSIASVRRRIDQLARTDANLIWLDSAGVVPLDERTALVGCDGWADGRFGDFDRSGIVLNDYVHIKELAGLSKTELLAVLHRLGDESAARLERPLRQALEGYERVIVLTHVPPFREACWHEGRISDADWLPHMACQATGQIIRNAAAGRPDRQCLVLCGHTHSQGQAQILPNLRVLTGAAVYGRPKVQCILDMTGEELGT